MRKLTLTILAAAALAGCESKPRAPLPVAERICIELEGVPANELRYLMRGAADTLKDHGFSLQSQQCDVQVKYSVFGEFAAEFTSSTLFWSQAQWSHEGLLAVEAGGATLVDRESIVLRRYSTRQSLLDALVWKLTWPVIQRFRPPGQT